MANLSATLLQCLSRLDLTVSTVTDHTVDNLMDRIVALDRYDEDEIFEIYEQLNQLTKAPTVSQTVDNDDDPVETDDMTRGDVTCGNPRNLFAFDPTRDIKPACAQLVQLNPTRNRVGFSTIFQQFSDTARRMFSDENITTPLVFSRLTNAEILSFNLNPSDTSTMSCLVIQCRAEELINHPKKTNQVRMPENMITTALPINARITLKVLQKSHLLSPNALYLFAPIESVLALFEKYPSIPVEDKKHILTGMAVARYAHQNSV